METTDTGVMNMAQLHAEMTLKIHPEMTEEGKELIRQMIREEIAAYIRNQQLVARDLQHDRLPPRHLDFEVK
jgi:hypothetical protein